MGLIGLFEAQDAAEPSGGFAHLFVGEERRGEEREGSGVVRWE